MTRLFTVAHAKLNLTLDVLVRRPDGYHDLEMVMQEISLGDALELELGTDQPWRMECSTGEIPCDDTNLCIKAARRPDRSADKIYPVLCRNGRRKFRRSSGSPAAVGAL